MRDLYDQSPTWKYVTFITGSEQMMMTNHELANYLRNANGTIFQSSSFQPKFNYRVDRKHILNEAHTKSYNPEIGSASK